MFMVKFSKEELEEALRAITSTISKSEKAQLKLKAGTIQHTMTERGINAYYIAVELINREMETDITTNSFESKYKKEELDEAIQTISSLINRVEKVQPKFEPGSSQHTLAVCRIKAFYIATELIKREVQMLITP